MRHDPGCLRNSNNIDKQIITITKSAPNQYSTLLSLFYSIACGKRQLFKAE